MIPVIIVILIALAMYCPLIRLIYVTRKNNNFIDNLYDKNNLCDNDNKMINYNDQMKFLNGEKDLSHYDLLLELKLNKFQVFYVNKYNVYFMI